MNGTGAAWRLGVGSLLGVALFFFLGRPLFGDDPVPRWVLPVALIVGWAWPVPWDALRRRSAASRAPWPVVVICSISLCALVALIAWGSLATDSRHWDGAVHWDVRAQALGASPTLAQPLFSDPAVYAHSRSYPVLQPFLMGGLERAGVPARLFFPWMMAALAALVAIGARWRNAPGWLPWVAALACVGTPALVNPTGGSADSGHAELLLAVAVTTIALGVVQRLPWVLALGQVIAIATKPEGLLIALLPVIIAFRRGDRRWLIATALGYAVGVMFWIPVHESLRPGVEGSVPAIAALLLAGVAAVVGADAVLRWRGGSPRIRTALTIAALVGAPLALIAVPGSWLPSDTALGRYLAERELLWSRLATLPEILGSFIEHAVLRWSFGGTFLLPLLLVVALRRERRALPPPAVALAELVLLGAVLILAPFLLSPESDLRHHLRSSMARLQLHWIGAVWLLTAAMLSALLRRHPRPARARETPVAAPPEPKVVTVP